MMSSNSNRPELLVPAGDMERLSSAISFGADAVYLAGKKFGMRASPNNFSPEQLADAVSACHQKGIKVYLTCNTIPRNDEVSALPEFMRECADAGIDALIVADIGVMALAKKHAPHLELHVSTQAGVANYETACTFYEMGASRVVLARELSLQEITEIRMKTPKQLELEAFVHGAMCVSFSGRCLLSSYLTGRDANRGDCAQPCRWEYELIEKKRPNERFAVEEHPLEGPLGSTYLLNSKDMCMIQHLQELMDAGINSFKIEGRAKSAYYVASVTAAYRAAIDHLLKAPEKPLPKWIVEETEKISHRAYSTGFYLGTEPGQNTEDGGYIRGWELSAVCEGRVREYLLLSQRNRFFRGETLEVLEPGKPPVSLELNEIYNGDMLPIEVAPHAAMQVYVKSSLPISKGAFLRKKLD